MKWQEKGHMLSEQGLHQGFINQTPNLLAYAASAPTPFLSLQLFHQVCLDMGVHWAGWAVGCCGRAGACPGFLRQAVAWEGRLGCLFIASGSAFKHFPAIPLPLL